VNVAGRTNRVRRSRVLPACTIRRTDDVPNGLVLENTLAIQVFWVYMGIEETDQIGFRMLDSYDTG
jgi:hypothetical protein